MANKKRLTLRKETLRVLTDDDLRRVVGGTGAVPDPSGRCNPGESEDPDDQTSAEYTADPTCTPCNATGDC